MAYTPKSSTEILRDLVAGVVARSEVTDIAEGSVLAQILSTVAAEMSGSEYRMSRIRDSFSLSNVTGSDLDERVSEFPLNTVTRLSASAARGNVLRLTRVEETVGGFLPLEATVPAGSIVGRSDDDSVIYATTDDVVFPAAPNASTQSIDNVSVVCLVSGTVGNCAAGSINKTIAMPSFISSMLQTSSMVGGQKAETDEGLRHRAFLHLSSLARCLPTSLEYFALSFIASDDTRARYAALYEDVERRGYSELVVDDGSVIVEGQEAATRPGRTITGTIPGTGQGLITIFHESPSAQPIRKIQRYDANNVEAEIIRPDKFVSLPERGIVYVQGGVFNEGDSYRIGSIQNDAESGYSVYTGSLIPEMQRAIEGDLNNPTVYPGLRAAGTRVRVLPPKVQPVNFDMMIVPISGVSFVDTADAVRESAVEFVLTLRPGDTLFVSQLIDRVMDNDDIIDVKFFTHDSANPGSRALGDIVPVGSRNVVLRPDPSKIIVIPPEDFE